MNKEDKAWVEDRIAIALSDHIRKDHEHPITVFDCPDCQRKTASIHVAKFHDSGEVVPISYGQTQPPRWVDLSHELCLSCGGKFQNKDTHRIEYEKLP